MPAPATNPPTRRPRWQRWLIDAALIALVFAAVQLWQTRHVPAGPAPAFAGPLAAGGQGSLAAWRAAHPGGPVAVYFWADWCPICKAQQGSISGLAEGWPVLTVAMQSGDPADVAKVLAERGLHWPTVVRLLLVVLWDIVVSNITVARLTLGSMQRPRPAWLRVPLATDHPRVNALFASIITTTPGTVSMTIDEERREILVHALNCDDPQAMVADMKARYEAPLMRIFQVDLDSPHGVRTGGQA